MPSETRTLELEIKAAWGDAEGFFWAPLLDDIGALLRNRRNHHLMVAYLRGLIAYGVREEEDLQNISDNKKVFEEMVSATGVPSLTCGLLFQKYVVEASLLEGSQRVN